MIDVGSLRRVVDEGLTVREGLLEEALANTLVHNNQGDLGWIILTLLALEEAVLLLDDLVQLLKLEVDHLLTHGITNTVTVDENVVWHLARIEITVALERPHEVVRQDSG